MRYLLMLFALVTFCAVSGYALEITTPSEFTQVEPKVWETRSLAAALEDPSRQIVADLIQVENNIDLLSRNPDIWKPNHTKLTSLLVDLLKDSNINIQLAALKTLAALGAQGKIDAIAQMLNSLDPLIQSGALRTLGQLNATGHVERIINLIKSENQHVRDAAILAFSKLEKSIFWQYFFKGCFSTIDPEAIISLLGTLDFKGNASISKLEKLNSLFIQEYRNPDSSYHDGALAALLTSYSYGYGITDKDIFEFREIATSRKDTEQILTIDLILHSLGKTEEEPTAMLRSTSCPFEITVIINTSVIEGIRDDWIVQQLDYAGPTEGHCYNTDEDEVIAVRYTAILALGLLNAYNHVDKIAYFLHDQDIRLRFAAIDALTLLNAQKYLKELKNILSWQSDYPLSPQDSFAKIYGMVKETIIEVPKKIDVLTLQLASLNALAKLGKKEEDSEAIVPFLNHKEASMRQTAISALAELNSQENILEISSLLNDSDERVRQTAVAALETLQAVEQTSAVVMMLQDQSERVRVAAVETLTSLGAHKELPLLLNFLEDSDSSVRKAALDCLPPSDVAKHINTIVTLLHDPSSPVRGAALGILIPRAPLETKYIFNIIESANRENKFELLLQESARNLADQRDQPLQAAIDWLVGPPKDLLKRVGEDSSYALATLQSFSHLWKQTTNYPLLRTKLADRIVDIVQKAPLEDNGLPVLKELESRLEQDKRSETIILRDKIHKLTPWKKKVSILYDEYKQQPITIQTLLIILLTWLASVTLLFFFLHIRPSVLLMVLRLPWDKMSSKNNLLMLGLAPLHLFFIPYFIRHRLTRNAWINDFKNGQNQFSNIPQIFYDEFITHDDVLDAWVEKHIKMARMIFGTNFFIDRQNYISMPVLASWLDSKQSETKKLIDSPTVNDFKNIFDSDRAVLSIIGDGGTGKSTLACQLIRWGMEENRRESLTNNLMLPIFIREDIPPEQELISVINELVQQLVNQQVEKKLLESLLNKGRLLIVVDALSELGKETQEIIRNIHADLLIKFLVITQRRSVNFGNVPVVQLEPQKLSMEQVVKFSEQYVLLNYKENPLKHSELLTILSHLSKVQEREGIQLQVTPLLITLHIDNAIRGKMKGGKWQNIPMTIPDTVIEYLKRLHSPTSDENNSSSKKVSEKEMLKVAKEAARICLGSRYVPGSVMRKNMEMELIKSISEKDIPQFIDCLIKNGILLNEEVLGERYVRFAFDPVAEYLAVILNMEKHKNNPTGWEKWRTSLKSLQGYPEEMSGFVEAMNNCEVTHGQQYGFVRQVD